MKTITAKTLEKVRKGIAGRIATARGERSQRSFARDIGVFQQNVNRYEHGTMPGMDFLITLAHVEGADLHEIITGKVLER